MDHDNHFIHRLQTWVHCVRLCNWHDKRWVLQWRSKCWNNCELFLFIHVHFNSLPHHCTSHHSSTITSHSNSLYHALPLDAEADYQSVQRKENICMVKIIITTQMQKRTNTSYCVVMFFSTFPFFLMVKLTFESYSLCDTAACAQLCLLHVAGVIIFWTKKQTK